MLETEEFLRPKISDLLSQVMKNSDSFHEDFNEMSIFESDVNYSHLINKNIEVRKQDKYGLQPDDLQHHRNTLKTVSTQAKSKHFQKNLEQHPEFVKAEPREMHSPIKIQQPVYVQNDLRSQEQYHKGTNGQGIVGDRFGSLQHQGYTGYNEKHEGYSFQQGVSYQPRQIQQQQFQPNFMR